MRNIIRIKLSNGEILRTEWGSEDDVVECVEEIKYKKFYQYEEDKYVNTDHIVKFEVI